MTARRFLQVIWAIGVSMLVLAALVHLPLRAIAILSVAMICGHNALDTMEPQTSAPGHRCGRCCMSPGRFLMRSLRTR